MKLFDTFVSYASNNDVRSIQQLLSVRLPADEMKEFRSAFHPRGRHVGRGFIELIMYQTHVVYYLESLFNVLRQSLLSITQFENEKSLSDFINSNWKLNYSENASIEEQIKKSVISYIRNIKEGSCHVIQPSAKFEGGYDLMFIGKRGLGYSTNGNGPVSQNTLPITLKEGSFQATAVNTKWGKAIVQLFKEINNILGPSTNDVNKSSYRRERRPKVIGVNTFRKLQEAIANGPTTKVGINIDSQQFLGELSEGLVKNLNKYYGVLYIREPLSNCISIKSQNPNLPDANLEVSEDSFYVNSRFTFAVYASIPKNFCEYISQDKNKISLFSLNTWAMMWAKSMFRIPNVKSGDLPPHRIPQYIIPPSRILEFREKRKNLGFYTENGKVNSDSLYISDSGCLSYLPKAQDSIEMSENAKVYETIVERAVGYCFSVGCPYTEETDNPFYKVIEPDFSDNLVKMNTLLQPYKGVGVGVDWDINSYLYIDTAEPHKLKSSKIGGATPPTPLNLRAFFNQPTAQAMFKMQADRFMVDTNNGSLQFSSKESLGRSDYFVQQFAFIGFAKMYEQMYQEKKVPNFQELVNLAAKDFGITSLDDEKVADFELLRNKNGPIYPYISTDLKVPTEIPSFVNIFSVLLRVVLENSTNTLTSTLVAFCAKNDIAVDEHERFFDISLPLKMFRHVYNWFGGRILLHAFKAFLAVPAKELNNYVNSVTGVSFRFLSTQIMPVIVMLTKYVHDQQDEIIKQADEMEDTNRNPKASEDELVIAGVTDKFAMFPHQARAAALQQNRPRHAVLDIDPGGGKTILGLTEIFSLYAAGELKNHLPFVLCPTGLIKNWVEDCAKISGGKFNAIPINSTIYNEWGDERLTELIKNAPRNTLVVVGFSFMSHANKVQLVVGNAVEEANDAVEFVKKFEPVYVLIDESHRVKNMGSNTHKVVKQIAQLSSVKYLRECTGTFIQTVLSDAVGQSSIISGQIFGSKDEFDSEFKEEIQGIGNNVVRDYKADAPTLVRQELNNYCTLITARRKEWAFMLPVPVETFIKAEFQQDVNDVTGKNLEIYYNAVLKETLNELKNNAEFKKFLNAGDDDDDDDNETVKETTNKVNIGSTQVEGTQKEEEEENLDNLEALLNPYLQRLERLLTDPFGDHELLPVAREIFGTDFDYENYVTPKVNLIIDRIKKHFELNPWKKGAKYKSGDIVDYSNSSFILRSEEPTGYSEITSTVSPDQDKENWKEQVRGKVVVFCRFTRSVEAIYKALPDSLRKKTVMFHGEVSDKWNNLDDFKNNDKIQILIGNEMGISEGHNLQMCTRFIRCEVPWSPGELDQSASRILRPDVENKFKREIIFLDWVIQDGSLEVCKLGRLVSRMLKKTQFDEVHNPTYYKDLNPLNLPIIKMSLSNIATLSRLSDLCAIDSEGSTGEIHDHSYIGQYRHLIHERGAEFKEMKKTLPAKMIPIQNKPLPKEAKVLDFHPWVPNMKVPDRYDEGLALLRTVLDEDEHPLAIAFKQDSDNLIGLPVRTEFGMGVIEKLRQKRGDTQDISRVAVKLDNGSVLTISPTKVYVCTKLSEKDRKTRNKTAPKITQSDKDRTLFNEKKLEQALEKANKKIKVTKIVEEEPIEEVLEAELYPIVYNGFLALQGYTDSEPKALKPFGFSAFGDYAHIDVINKKEYDAIMDWLDAKFYISDKLWKFLESFEDSFASGRGKKFDVSQRPNSEFQMFYRTSHKLTEVKNSKRPDLKVYPVILNQHLMFAIDLSTNPVFKRYLNKAIPGATKKFVEEEGSEVQFFSTKKDMLQKIREMLSAGVRIINLDELKEEIAELDLKALGWK